MWVLVHTFKKNPLASLQLLDVAPHRQLGHFLHRRCVRRRADDLGELMGDHGAEIVRTQRVYREHLAELARIQQTRLGFAEGRLGPEGEIEQ